MKTLRSINVPAVAGAVAAGLTVAASAHAELPTEVSDLFGMADTTAITAFFSGLAVVAVTAILIQSGVRWVKRALGMF